MTEPRAGDPFDDDLDGWLDDGPDDLDDLDGVDGSGADGTDADDESHRGGFGEYGGESGAFIERTFRERIIVVGVSFSIKRLIGQRVWRALHGLTFVLYALTLLHGLGAGSDARTPWAQVLYLVTGAAVVLFSCYRLLRRDWRKSPAPVVPEPSRDRPVQSLPA